MTEHTMTQQEKSEYWHKYHKKLNKFAPLNGTGENDRLVARLLRSYLNVALQALEQGGINRADFAVQFISESQFKEILSELYLNTGMYFADWVYKNLKSIKRESPGMSVGFMSESYKMLISQLLDKPIIADRIKGITDETRKQIRSILVEANNRNLDVRATARLIREKTPSIVKSRALLISRTETTLAASLGAQFGARQTRLVLEKVWIATRDSRTRDAHLSMLNSEPIPQGSHFNVGGKKMLFPGDPAGGASNCCNCRCAVAFIPAKEQPQEREATPGINPFNYIVGGIVLEELLS